MTPRESDPHYAVGAASDWLPLGIWLDQSGSADVSHDARLAWLALNREASLTA